MWYCNDKYKKDLVDFNKELLKIEGTMLDKEAKISLAKFLRANLGLTTELISGIKLAPYQEVTLKGFFNRNFNMCVWGRGCSKSFIASVYIFLQCIFEPNSKILIAGPTFRTARNIFTNLEKLVNSKEAQLLQQAFGVKSKRNDLFEWEINGGNIVAIPLNGEKVRGFRANVLVLDEFLLIPEEIIKNVLMPFLVAPQNMKERIQIREIEDKLIAEGLMKEDERMIFPNKSKMIALSSASYTFENLYKTYQEWVANIYSDEAVRDATYFVSQMGYESLPEEMVDKTIIEEAQAGGLSHSGFLREYCAQFTDGSDSYFSAKKMHECTIKDGENPTSKIYGDKDKKYILAIDPSFSNSPSSDYFAMSVLEIDDEKKDCIIVHSYAVAGGDLKDHILYFHYLLNNFNVEMIIIDNAGYQFIDSANENELFRKSGINLKFFDVNSDAEGVEYDLMLRDAKRQYNKETKRICFKQVFTTEFIRKGNEYLQASIDHKKIWFASRISANGDSFGRVTGSNINIESTGFNNLIDFIENQDDMIYATKKECSLIEVKSTSRGFQSFDLPQHLKRNTSANRARKDRYTALMLGNWASKIYYDMNKIENKMENDTFTPIMLK